jgi:glutathione S-transferase/RNA polymerase-associated protein
MPVLYEHPLSPYAQKNKIALREKGVPFELRLPAAIGSGTTLDPEFAAASPRGEVPALVDGALRVFDSTVILEYIEDRWPEPPLLPRSPAERARVRMLEDAMDTHYEAINWALAEILLFRRARGALADELVARAAEQTAAWRGWLEAQLGERRWFNGDAFGWGDLCVIPFLNGSAGFGNGPEPGTRLHDWFVRANERGSVARTAAEAAAAAAAMGEAARRVESGAFRREYRDHRLEWMVSSGGVSVVLEGLEKKNVRFVEPFAPPPEAPRR